MSPVDFWSGKRVVVTGGAGFIGSYVVKNLIEKRGIAPERVVIPRSKEFDLRKLEDCERVIRGCQVVIHLAAVTGGIAFSRSNPARQYYESTLIDLNVLEAARRQKAEKLIALGNLFAYASDAPIPLVEKDLFEGLPTDAHRGVGWLKRNLALLADLYSRQYNFPMAVIYSANAYGPGDSIDPAHAHVIPATIIKCFRDKELIVWGDGSPTRDFLFVEEIASALTLAAEKLAPPRFVNIGSGKEISVRELIGLIVKLTGFKGNVIFDSSKSGGDARRFTSIDLAEQLMGFKPTISMEEGLRQTVAWYRNRLVCQ